MKSLILVLLLFFTLSSCKKSEAVAEFSDMAISAVPLAPKSSSNSYADKKDSPNKEDQKIIKQGNLRLESNDLESTYNQIQTAVKKHTATILNDNEGKNDYEVYRRLIVRVPSNKFDVFLNDISKGVSYFDNKEISSQDVTEEYIDIDARLKAKKVLESRYIELLKKANKVSEMLEIEGQLSAIREEIEAKEGQLRYMQSRVSYSTITIEFYKPMAEASGATMSYGSKIWNAIKSGFNSISSFFITLLEIWPFILILGTGIYFVRKRYQNKKI
ncbi:DUF4349 domain-containing protein [Flavobacterium ovatum]|uniref:DUF4349 domain-containing protein n=1 Tax=Flavobacterium ovatum TaxID=1928857 RepID=UPI00344E08B6